MSISKTRLRWLFASLAAAGIVALAGTALASPDYPEEVAGQLDMECPPPCTICHDTQSGGSGTARKSFATEMIENGGLEGENVDSVKTALDALESSGADSDGDGTGDIEELRASTDPNVSGGASICGPAFGCGAHVSASDRVDPVALLMALAVGGLFLGLGRRRPKNALR